jgi:hypothetical protein
MGERKLKIDKNQYRFKKKFLTTCPVTLSTVCPNIQCKMVQAEDREEEAVCARCGTSLLFGQVKAMEQQSRVTVKAHLQLFLRSSEFKHHIDNLPPMPTTTEISCSFVALP